MKKVITAIMIVLSIMISIVPFSSDVKAEGKLNHGTFVYGNYDLLYSTSGIDIGSIFGSINFGSTVLYIQIELDQVYNGWLTVTASGIQSFADFGIVAVGAQIDNVSNATNQVILSLDQGQIIHLLYVSNKSYNTNTNWSITISGSGMAGLGTELSTVREISVAMSGINTGISNIFAGLNNIEDALALLQQSIQPVYNLPIESIQAWLFAKNTYDQIQYNPGDVYPYFYIHDGQGTRIINLPASSDVQYLFYASKNFTASGNYHVEPSNSNFVVTLQQINDYRLSGYTLFSVVIHNKALTAQSGRLWYSLSENGTAQTITLIPVYFGLPGAMPEEIYKMIYGQSMTEDYLSQILEWLNGYSNASTTEVTEYNETIIDINLYLNNLFSLMPDLDGFNVDFDMTSDKHSVVNTFTNVSNFVDYVYNGISTAVPEITVLVVLGLASMVLGILL